MNGLPIRAVCCGFGSWLSLATTLFTVEGRLRSARRRYRTSATPAGRGTNPVQWAPCASADSREAENALFSSGKEMNLTGHGPPGSDRMRTNARAPHGSEWGFPGRMTGRESGLVHMRGWWAGGRGIQSKLKLFFFLFICICFLFSNPSFRTEV
jgi:hypothetical protein